MRKSITLRAFPASMPTMARVRLAREAGFVGVEVNLEATEEFSLDASEQTLVALQRAIADEGMVVSAAYCREQWLNPITSQSAETRARGAAIVEKLLRAATFLQTDTVLVVPGAVDNSVFAANPEIVPYDIAYNNAQQVLRDLAARVAPVTQVTLAIENVWGKFLQSPLEMARFIDEIESPWAGAYFDVGNILRTGYPEHWIRILNQRIRRVHFKDYRLASGDLTGFVGLLQGDVNWPAVMDALRAINYDGWVTAEVLPAYRYYGERLIHETSAAMDAILSG